MKMFMATLEDKARVWYEGLPLGSLCSLKDFHRIFFGQYGKSHPSSPLFQDCCNFWKGFIQYLESINDYVECMDDEILEELYEFSSQASCHDDQEVFQQADVSSSVEDEMDQQFDIQVKYMKSMRICSPVNLYAVKGMSQFIQIVF